MVSFSQFMTTSQFYLYGKKHFTRTGWENNSRMYPLPDPLEDPSLDLSGFVFMITGANSGIGKEIAAFYAQKRGTVFMVCRSAERAESARSAIVQSSNNDNVFVLLGDCGLEADVRRVWSEFEQHPASKDAIGETRLHCLICNAGALANEKEFTSEGVEVTFATHLLFGTYLLGTLALPTLTKTPDSRMIAVSSGGMYNTKFPSWELATSTGIQKFDGQLAYAYAKRGQVLLMEYWAANYPAAKFLSCHPGWTDTPGVEAAYGAKKSYLEPLRTLWQGAEGIIWLGLTPSKQLVSGSFYLDRQEQPKHLAGPFFSEGSFTKNSPEEVLSLVDNLAAWSSGERPSLEEIARRQALQRPLQSLSSPLDVPRFMGAWYVLAVIPTPLEAGVFNSVEAYRWEEKDSTVRITFTYRSQPTSSTSEMHMKASMRNRTCTEWSLSPKLVGFFLPLGITYLVVDLGDDYEYTTIGVPDRSYLWVMIRRVPTEFPATNVPVLQAYGLEAWAEQLGEEGGLKGGEGEEVKGEGEGEGTGRGMQQREWEKEVLKKALRRARGMGYPLEKVLRAPWVV